jgi:ATP-dependent RNA helicase RhlE
LVREVETGFVPTHSVPLTRQVRVRPKKPKKPKKPKEPTQVHGQVKDEGRRTDGKKTDHGNKPRRGDKAVETAESKEGGGASRSQRRNRSGGSGKK